ncbi:MAG: DUF1771 domain-containing protein [Bacteroidetes bacterium]|nr:DUF1771 domain-containing protein [Bacteroidota bacterium]
METGKAHFIKEVEEARRRARDAKTAARAARQRYEETAAELQPRIDELSREADELAAKFKRLYEESQARYEARDGSVAKELAMEGHDAENRCRRLNGEANNLRKELKGLYDAYERLNEEAERLEESASISEEQGLMLRGTGIHHFNKSAMGSDFAVEEFLDTFPQGLFRNVRFIEYRTALEKHEEGCFGITLRNNIIGNSTISIFPHENEDKQGLKETISHELGHVVLHGFLALAERDKWATLLKDLALAGKKISKFAWSPDEYFCECFAAFKTNPRKLKKFDIRVYTLMEDIYKSLPK